jgi:transcriptional regulator with XRE-family HTH domain
MATQRQTSTNIQTPNSIGIRIKIVRKEMGLTQKEIAKHFNITAAYWSAIETGVKQVTVDILLTLINEFSISSDWILTGKGEGNTIR